MATEAGVFAGNLWTGYLYEKTSIQHAIMIDAVILALLIALPVFMLKREAPGWRHTVLPENMTP
jgi:predicted MFS family arabinose efflux permease